MTQSAILFEVYTTHMPSRKIGGFRPERFTLFPYIWSSQSASELESRELEDDGVDVVGERRQMARSESTVVGRWPADEADEGRGEPVGAGCKT